MPEGDNEKNQNGNEIRNLDSLKKVNLDAISSSLNEASAEINEKQKQLDGLEEQKKKVLEKLNQKISLIKKETDEALQKMKSSSWDNALLNWNKVLEIDPENEEAKKGIAECHSQRASLQNAPSALKEIEKEKKSVSEASSAAEAMSQDDLDKLLASGGLTFSEPPKKDAGSPGEAENLNESLSQEELDKLLFGSTAPPKTEDMPQTSEKGKEDLTLSQGSNAAQSMSQNELDALLNNFSKEGIPDIYASTAQEGTNKPVKKEPPEPEMLSQNQIDTLLGISTPPNEPSSVNSSPEMMTQEELDKLLNPSPSSEPEKEAQAPSQPIVAPAESLQTEPSTQPEEFKLKTTDDDLLQLDSVFNSLAYTAPIKNIVEDPLSELHQKPVENIHFAEILDESRNIDEVFKEMATSTGLDLNEVSKMGDTIAANVSQEMQSIPSEKSVEGGQSSVSESISIAARKTKVGITQMLPDVKMMTESFTSLKFLFVMKCLIVILSLGFICTLTSTLILYSRLHQKDKGEQSSRKELTSDERIEIVLTEGKKFLDDGDYQKAWDILFSISDQYPSTSIMINNLYKAADLFNDKCKKREDLVQEDYLKISRLYEQIVDHFQGSTKTERASYLAAENYYMAGIYHKSYELYFKIVSRNPESDYYQSSLLQCAKILLIENKYKEARETYLKVVQEFPDTAAARMSQLDIAKTYQLEALNIRNQFHFIEKR